MTVSESLLRISELTKQNLQILQLINDSFYTKSNHISTVVGDTAYTIPSYIAIENKINHVQDAMNNLVHAAKSGEAWFNFDGNSKEILVRGYQQAPSPVALTPKTKFNAETKTLFKDMLTPQPYLNFDMSSLPDDINSVIVKKIVPYNQTLQQALVQTTGVTDESAKASAELAWPELVRMMGSGAVTYQKGTDYLEYDTVYELPVRNCTRSGKYIIEEVISDKIDKSLENIVKVRIHESTPLVCTNFDGTGETELSAGDTVVTFDGSAKLKIITINKSARTLELKVLSGEYVNLIGAGEKVVQVSDYSILNLYSSPETARNLHIPLEEDKYVYITIAPLNPRLNIQSAWGTGLMLNVDNLRLEGLADENSVGFREYYNKNVNNIGDAMAEIASIAYPPITKFSGTDMEAMTASPLFNEDTLKVVQINRHLNDSDAVQNIRALYSQKKQYQADLKEVQSRIESLNQTLATISFDDMSGTRSAYTAQITDLKDQQNELTTSINKIIDSIATTANNAEVPIEAAKFRIRGYVDVEQYVEDLKQQLGDGYTVDDIRENILGVEVKYRYRNSTNPQANVAVIGDNFLFTEWATYNPPLRERSMVYKDGGYKTSRNDVSDDGFNYSMNEPKFNQVDIPISQGESVEVMVRILWGFGHPFVTVATEWSDAINVDFPAELVKDVQVTTIIEENNSDIETNRFETILQNKGVNSHVDDSIDDQDIKYFHKPESISSGFYTEERRIIPLSTKLNELNTIVTELKDIYDGSFADQLKVTLTVDNVANPIEPDIDNIIQLPAWSSIQQSPSTDNIIMTGSLYKVNTVVYTTALLTLSNPTNHTLNIFSVYPGSRDTFIKGLDHWVIDPKNTIYNEEDGPTIVWLTSDRKEANVIKKGPLAYEQRANQTITFRRTNPYNGSVIGIGTDDTKYTDRKYDANTYDLNGLIKSPGEKSFLYAWPATSSKYGMCIDSDAVMGKYSIAPGGSVSFPILIEYKCKDTGSNSEFTLGFQVRNSLYSDPLYYQIHLFAKYNQTTQDRIQTAKIATDSSTRYNSTVR